MEETSLFHKMTLSLRSTCKYLIYWYYTGLLKDLHQVSFVLLRNETLCNFFIMIIPWWLHLRSSVTSRNVFDKVLEEAAAEFYPSSARKILDFALHTRRQNESEAANLGKVVDPNTTKYSAKVLPFNYDLSAYGFREFFKRHVIQSSDPK